MSAELLKILRERISSGLKRRALTTCSRWAQSCRVMGKPFPGPWTFRHHPWLREMHDSAAEMNVGQKAAQVGYTETLLNLAFYHIDVKAVDCLYVLPAKTPDAGDFSAGRFNPALELSPHLSSLFSDVKNIGHKRAGNTNLYIRGSKSRAGLKSIPTGLIILDEVDEMDERNVPLALERSAGQVEKMTWAVSTPTIPGYGINRLYSDSTQEHYFFRCPGCSRLTELTFPDCLEVTAEDVNDPRVEESHLKCRECKCRLEHRSKAQWLADGKWIAGATDASTRGFYVNQLYSTTVTPGNFARAFLRAQRDETEEQEFYNSKLGLEHVVKGAGISDADIDACRGGYKMSDRSAGSRLVTMGVDVGRWLHVEVDEWTIPGNATSVDLNVQSRPRVIAILKVLNFEELDRLMREFRVNFCVIDANPERRKAYEFACRFFGYVKMCFYGQGVVGKQIHVSNESNDEPTITVDRTSWLDLSLGRFHNRGIAIPVDAPLEYRTHLKSLVRVYEKDKTGQPVGRYLKGKDDDHYAHARNYAELALPFAVGLGASQDMGDVI